MRSFASFMILPKASSRFMPHNKNIVCLLSANMESAQMAPLQKTVTEWIEDEQMSREAQTTLIFQDFSNFKKKSNKWQASSQEL